MNYKCAELAPAFGLLHALRQRQQAGRTPNASRSLVAALARRANCRSWQNLEGDYAAGLDGWLRVASREHLPVLLQPG